MKTSFFTRLFAGALIVTVTLTAFSEKTSYNNTTQPVFNASAGSAKTGAPVIFSQLLNQNLAVTFAIDNGVDITEDMNDWTFRFNGDYPGGEAQGWNDILSVTGNWSMAEGADNISIMFPSSPSQAAFMSRTWTINNSNSKGGEIVLTAADGDEVHLISDIQ